jgi:hypothetical protein
MEEYKSTKRGRPTKYFSEDERLQAQKKYRRKWYDNNKAKVKLSYNPVKAQENRKKRILSGYFIIFSDERFEFYTGFSRDIKARVNDIMRGIKDLDKSTPLIDKFAKNIIWRYKILFFTNQKEDAIIDDIKMEWSEYYEL